AEVDAFFAEVGRVDVEILGLQHQLVALRGGAVVLDQKYSHTNPLDSSVLGRERRTLEPARGNGSTPIRYATGQWLTDPDSGHNRIVSPASRKSRSPLASLWKSGSDMVTTPV